MSSLELESSEDMILNHLKIHLDGDTHEVKLEDGNNNYIRLTVRDMFLIGEKSMVYIGNEEKTLISISDRGVTNISIYVDNISCVDIIEHTNRGVVSRIKIDKVDFIKVLLWLKRGIDIRERELDVH